MPWTLGLHQKDNAMSANEAPKPINEGAIKAGNGDYIFKLPELARMEAGRGVSTGEGPVVEGARMQVGLISKKRGNPLTSVTIL